MITPGERDTMRRIARSANRVHPGPWRAGDYGEVGDFEGEPVYVSDCCEIGVSAVNKHIAAFDPPTVIAVLDMVDELERRLDAVLEMHRDDGYGDCSHCEMGTGQGVTFPCWTYECAAGGQ